MNSKYKLFTLNNILTPNFTMIPLELKDYINFEVKRVYFIAPPIGDKPTGSHCHYKEDELFIQVQGSCNITVDDGQGIKDIKLDGLKSAIYVPHMVWHGFKDLSSDCIIMAITSTNYSADRSDYCEDHSQFQKLVSIPDRKAPHDSESSI